MMGHDNLTWVVGAITDADRELVSYGERRLRFVGTPPAMYDLFYGVFCNPVLWFLQHSIWHLLDRGPDLQKDIMHAWEHGFARQQAFARRRRRVKSANGVARVMLHDYHLYSAPVHRDAAPVCLCSTIRIPGPALRPGRLRR
jgi:trehalose-6-phosphate synthase